MALCLLLHWFAVFIRVGRVCRLWNGAASSPVLWRSVSVGYCWIEPGKSQLPGTEQKIRNTIGWLAENRSVVEPYKCMLLFFYTGRSY